MPSPNVAIESVEDQRHALMPHHDSDELRQGNEDEGELDHAERLTRAEFAGVGA